MTSRDEAIRALEKAVELVAKATKGPWAFMNEKFDDCLLAFGTDSLDYDAPPPWYSCWTSINPDDGRAIIAAVNFIREHGAAILSARQEVAPVAEIGELNGTKLIVGRDEDALSRLPNGTKLYTSPAHTSEARDAARYRWLREEAGRDKRGSDHDRLHVSINYPTKMADGSGYTGLLVTPRGDDFDARVDAAMRQEAGDE